MWKFSRKKPGLCLPGAIQSGPVHLRGLLGPKQEVRKSGCHLGLIPSQSDFGFSALLFGPKPPPKFCPALPPLQALPTLSFSLGSEVPSPFALLTLLLEHFPSRELSLANREPSGILQTSSQARPVLLKPAALVLPAEKRASHHTLEWPLHLLSSPVKVTQA